MPQWRLTLDVPHTFAVEPGFQRAVHHSDFRPDKDSHNNTYRCPVTGLVMLSPSFERRDFTSDFKRLSSWRYKNPRWQEVQRAVSPQATTPVPNMFTAVKPAGEGFSLIELLVDVAIMAIAIDLLYGDTMKWVLESKFAIASDEGFSIHYHALGDEIGRRENWFAVQWDNIGLHFSCNGIVKVYQYDRASLTTPAKLVHEFQIASAGELLNKSGYFNFIPCPNFGLIVTHSRIGQRSAFQPSNGGSGTARGHLIPWDTRTLETGLRLFESSMVRIGYNPYLPCVIGFQSISYPESGDYTDAITDPGFKPSIAPIGSASAVDTGYGSVTAYFVKPDKSGAWEAGTDRQGRVKIALTSDASRKHSPCVYGYGIAWEPQFAVRNTTPVEISRFSSIDGFMGLEWTQDIDGNFEGKATMLVSTVTLGKIVFRGDSTFRLDWRKQDGDAWQVLAGGLAKDFKPVEMWHINFGTCYQVTCVLKGMEERFRECHSLVESAFDGLDLGQAFNVLLRGCSLQSLLTIPPEATAIKIPPPKDGKTWRFAPKSGAKGDEIRDTLLMFMRKQRQEWRLPYNWAQQRFVLERRPRLDEEFAWVISPTIGNNEALRRWEYDNPATYDIETPEANLIIVEGLTEPTPGGKRIQASSVNKGSIFDPLSDDYLGRVLVAKLTVHGVSDKNLLRIMARRVKEAISHRRHKHTVSCPRLAMSLIPGTLVNKYTTEGDYLFSGWVKERHVNVTEDDFETMTLHMDRIWEGGI